MTSKELFAAFLTVYKHVAAGAVPVERAGDIQVKDVGKFSDIREALKGLRAGVKFSLEWGVADTTVDLETWCRLLQVEERVYHRVSALRWAAGLLGMQLGFDEGSDSVEYDAKWVAAALPRIREAFSRGRTAASRWDLDEYSAAASKGRHLETLEYWATPYVGDVQPAAPSPKSTGGGQVVLEVEPTPRPAPKHAPTVIELDAAPTAAQPVVAQTTTIELEPTVRPAAPTAQPSNALDLQSFSLEQLRALAQAHVPGASDEIVRRMQVGQ